MVWVNQAGIEKEVTMAWIKESGIWKEDISGGTPSGPNYRINSLGSETVISEFLSYDSGKMASTGTDNIILADRTSNHVTVFNTVTENYSTITNLQSNIITCIDGNLTVYRSNNNAIYSYNGISNQLSPTSYALSPTVSGAVAITHNSSHYIFLKSTSIITVPKANTGVVNVLPFSVVSGGIDIDMIDDDTLIMVNGNRDIYVYNINAGALILTSDINSSAGGIAWHKNQIVTQWGNDFFIQDVLFERI